MGTCVRDGWVLPLVDESTWPVSFRITLYSLGLLWFLVAEAVTVTAPLTAIEVLTSLTKTKRVISDPDNPECLEEISVRRWNLAVANLTLIAFGTCTPKILLATMEIIGSEFYTGELGVATIVGSSAFSLLFVTGVSIMATPSGKTRYIKKAKPYFIVVLVFSLFAYLWIFLILEIISPKKIELWEACLTLALYPVLVILVYVIDSWSQRKKITTIGKLFKAGKDYIKTATADVNAANIIRIMKGLGANPKQRLTAEEIAAYATLEAQKDIPRSAAWYRVSATRNASGGQRLVPKVNPLPKKEKIFDTITAGALQDKPAVFKSVVEFSSKSYSVLEKDERVSLKIVRSGNTQRQVLFRYKTIDGTAKSGSDFTRGNGVLVFRPGECDIKLDIDILDNKQWEEKETFYVQLSPNHPDDPVLIGNNDLAAVTIIDDDHPGVLEFSQSVYFFEESVGTAELCVVRKHGSRGRISVTWKTVDKTAIGGKDYESKEGEIVFEDGETEKSLGIVIYDDQKYELNEFFAVKLSTAQGGACVGGVSKASVTIMNDDEYKNLVDKVVLLTRVNIDRLKLGTSSWAQQFKEAMSVNGGDTANATPFDYFAHFVSFFWKVVTACVPPPNFLNSRGVITLIIGLCLEGFVVAVMVDMANTFGCLVGLQQSVIAVIFTSTFVSLGTSLPDLIATRMSASSDKYADTSVGVAIGNSAVMVYLGLGLPWVLAASYWTTKDQLFEIQTHTLAFNIPVYCVLALISVTLLKIRRALTVCGQAELGGPTIPKVISGILFVLLWLIFILLSSLYAQEIISFS
ncbi:sodium/calcium exchanger 2-like [Ptychodera flava]|uniref:sodium/calcium exchanger 2-like n=1 Tax=Ptychodera flava TaxID=63121 RepID=UPI00396AB03C